MTVQAINDPLFEYTCDFCGTVVRDKWIPTNWEFCSLSLFQSGMGSFHICQECQISNTIVFLFNKAKANMVVASEH